jgi:hypothetical protein
MAEFFERLDGHGVGVVGPSYLREIPLDYSQFVEVPDRDAFLEIDRIQAEMDEINAEIILVVAGFAAKPLIYRSKAKACILDCGSALDPFARKYNRQYQRELFEVTHIDYFVRCSDGVTVNEKKFPCGWNQVPSKLYPAVVELDRLWQESVR